MSFDRIIETNPWNTVDKEIDVLISKVVLQMNPEVLDDDLNDLLDDWDNRENAIDYLIDKLIKIKEG